MLQYVMGERYKPLNLYKVMFKVGKTGILSMTKIKDEDVIHIHSLVNDQPLLRPQLIQH